MGDHVSSNLEAGRVSGTATKVITARDREGYKVHASKQEQQYEIKSDKTGHMAIHKGWALTKLLDEARRGTTARYSCTAQPRYGKEDFEDACEMMHGLQCTKIVR